MDNRLLHLPTRYKCGRAETSNTFCKYLKDVDPQKSLLRSCPVKLWSMHSCFLCPHQSVSEISLKPCNTHSKKLCGSVHMTEFLYFFPKLVFKHVFTRYPWGTFFSHFFVTSSLPRKSQGKTGQTGLTSFAPD